MNCCTIIIQNYAIVLRLGTTELNNHLHILVNNNGISIDIVSLYSRTLIIQTPVCHFNVKGIQISEFIQISELSDKMHYLAS